MKANAQNPSTRCYVCHWLQQFSLSPQVESSPKTWQCTICSINSLRSNTAVPVYTSDSERQLCNQHCSESCSICGFSYTDYDRAKYVCDKLMMNQPRQSFVEQVTTELFLQVEKMAKQGSPLKVEVAKLPEEALARPEEMMQDHSTTGKQFSPKTILDALGVYLPSWAMKWSCLGSHDARDTP